METKEKNLEQDIESWLLSEGGYVKGTMATYVKKRAIDMPVLIKFIEATQPKQWERYKNIYGSAPESAIRFSFKVVEADMPYDPIMDRENEFVMSNGASNFGKSNTFFAHMTSLDFKWKSEDIAGLQIADLIAYPLTRYVLNPQAVNLAYDVLAPNIFMEDGKLLGLKIYPSQQA